MGERVHDVRRSGVDVLLVDHDMSLVLGVCDVIHVLDVGALIASGTPAEIKSSPIVAEAYLGSTHAGSGNRDDDGARMPRASMPDTAAGPVVRGFDLTLTSGEVVALLGPNGAGKTTVLLTLAGLVPSLGGTVEVLGHAIPNGPLRTRWRGSGSCSFPTTARCSRR